MRIVLHKAAVLNGN